MIGKTISHYRIIEELGRGGMGVVYKAEDLTLKRTVALKFLAPHILADEVQKKRLLYEARAAAGLDHPNISTVHEIHEAEGQTFMVMAFIEGEDLGERIESGPLKLEDAYDIAIQVASGLAKAHGEGIVHRDIKPGNVLITPEGQVKLVDFGLAKLASHTRLTVEGTTMGTVMYMSPEQAMGADADHRADIWALGVILYEMLAGRLPFRGEAEPAIMYSILNEDPEALSDIRKDIPVALEEILEKALSKDADKRYQTMDELLTDLREQQEKLTLGIRERKFRVFRKLRRRKRLVAVTAIAVVLTAIAIVLWTMSLAPVTTMDSLAVLPFANLSGDPEQEYVSNGMTDALINEVGQISALRVISRTSVMQFKETDKSLPEIARQLDVDVVVEASVLRDGDRIRITAKLIKPDPEELLWSQSYNREGRDVNMVLSEIARAIAEQIQVTVTPQEQEQLVNARTVDPEAYDAYLRGLHYLNSWDHMKALSQFMKAIQIDPTYAEAYTGLSLCYNGLGLFGILTPREAFPKAKAAAEKALELDDSQGRAHAALAFVKLVYDWDWYGPDVDYRKAVELSPNNAEVLIAYDMYLTLLGRYKEAVEYCKSAIELDPLTLEHTLNLAWIYNYAGMYDEAIETTNEVLKIASSEYAYSTLADSYFKKEMYPEAIAFYDSAFSLSGDSSTPVLLAAGGYVYARSGREDKAKEILNQLLSLSGSEKVSPIFIAQVYSGLRQTDEMFEWLEKSYAAREGISIQLDFGEYRDDPRYIDLCRRIGIPLD